MSSFPLDCLCIVAEYVSELKTLLALKDTCPKVHEFICHSDAIWKKFQLFLCFREEKSIYFKDYCGYYRSKLLTGMAKQRMKGGQSRLFVEHSYDSTADLDRYEATEEEKKMVMSSIDCYQNSYDEFLANVQENDICFTRYHLFYTHPNDSLFYEITYYLGDNQYGVICMREYPGVICGNSDTVRYIDNGAPDVIKRDRNLAIAWHLGKFRLSHEYQ